MVVMVFEIDQELYDKVTAVLVPQGLTLSDAIVLLFEKAAELDRIPFAFTPEDLEEAKQSNSIRLVAEYEEENS